MKRKIVFSTLRVLWVSGLLLTALALAVTPFVWGASLKHSEPSVGEYPVLIAIAFVYCCAIPYVTGLFTGLRIINLLVPKKKRILPRSY